MCGEHDYTRIRELRSNRRDGVDAAHPWHLEIHEHDVWAQRSKLLDSLSASRVDAGRVRHILGTVAILFSRNRHRLALSYSYTI